MKFDIHHELHFDYSGAVYIEPHTFYLRPRETGNQRLHAFNISFEPEPVLQTWFTDAFGNSGLKTHFEGKHKQLKVCADSQVETLLTNPFDYLPDPGCLELPATYPHELSFYFAPYFQDHFDALPVDVVQFAESLAARCGNQVLTFLPELCNALYSDFKKIHRETGEPWAPAVTLSRKEGSCRDLSLLFMACCRARNLAARFVSGYYEADPDIPDKDLHAWVEVYVEGGGWRGFDPTSGLAVDAHYVPLAASPKSAFVAPSRGTFRGTGVQGKLTAKVLVTQSPPVHPAEPIKSPS